jgi:hypothetical protein
LSFQVDVPDRNITGAAAFYIKQHYSPYFTSSYPFGNGDTYPCRLPAKITSMANVILDNNRDWNSIIVLATNQEVSSTISQFYIFLLIPLFGILYSISVTVAVIIIARKKKLVTSK